MVQRLGSPRGSLCSAHAASGRPRPCLLAARLPACSAEVEMRPQPRCPSRAVGLLFQLSVLASWSSFYLFFLLPVFWGVCCKVNTHSSFKFSRRTVPFLPMECLCFSLVVSLLGRSLCLTLLHPLSCPVMAVSMVSLCNPPPRNAPVWWCVEWVRVASAPLGFS